MSLLWIGVICGIALYEYAIVDPWQFLGEDRGAIFYRWSPQLVYDRSPFGDFVLRLDPQRFWLTLVLPPCGVWIMAAALAWYMRSKAGRD